MNAACYIMEDEREASRLTQKVDAAQWVGKYLAPLLPASGRVLEVGCGPGVLAVAAATGRPALQVTGVDLSASRFRDALRLQPVPVTLQVANACALPFDDDSFDVVYSRFLLEYLAGRERAVGEMLRVCRAGGRVLLQDLDGQLLWHFPEDAQLSAQMARVLQVLGSTGFDPLVGRKLYGLARQAGLVALSVQAEAYHLIAGRPDTQTLALWDLKLDIALPVATQALGSLAQARNLKRRFLDYLQREDTLTYSVVFTVVGTKPGG